MPLKKNNTDAPSIRLCSVSQQKSFLNSKDAGKGDNPKFMILFSDKSEFYSPSSIIQSYFDKKKNEI